MGRRLVSPSALKQCGRCPAMILRRSGRRFCPDCVLGKKKTRPRDEIERIARLGGEPLTYEEIALVLDCSRTQVQNEEATALYKLRDLMSELGETWENWL